MMTTINKEHQMTEMTPVYSRSEKIKQICIWIPIFILMGIFQFVVSPWIKSTYWFFCHPHALDYFYLFIGGFPLVIMLIFIALAPRDLRIIRLKQYPLPEQKTWTAQPYRYGLKATWRSYASLLMIPILFGMSFWTYSVAQDLRAGINPEELQEVRALECKNTDA